MPPQPTGSVGMPAWLHLQHFGKIVYDVFDMHPYLVGSATRTKQWRDVDVRLILPDAEFERWCGELTRPRYLNPRWNGLCIAFAHLGMQMTGLPIDFQIDQMTEANELFGDQIREPLGIVLDRHWHPGGEG